MILAANQITFIPWIGFFDLIRCSDVWVTLDTFQMPDRSFISRNRVKYDDNNIRWISIPLKAYKSQTQINEIQIIQDKWWKKIINRLSNYYSKAKYFRVVHSLVEHILPPHENYLVDYNERVLRNLCTIVNIQFSPIRLSNLTIEHSCGTDATDNLLVALCKKFGADCYYNFRCGVDEGMHKCENYASNGIKLYKQAFNHLEYQQCGEKFISHMSILDALYNVGPEETKNLIITGSG
jgi:hypothetical protein